MQSIKELAKKHTRFSLEPYRSVRGAPACGWECFYGVRMTDAPITLRQAEDFFERDWVRAERALSTFFSSFETVPPLWRDVLTSCALSVGTSIMHSCGVLVAVDTGDYSRAEKLFASLTTLNGRQQQSLVSRRAAELMYLRGGRE